MPPIPPPKLSPLESAKVQLERIGIVVSGTRWAWTATVGLVSLWAGSAYSPGRESMRSVASHPVPHPVPQTSTGSAEVMSWVPLPFGTLPPPDVARQKKPPCATKFGEAAINGWCWFQVANATPPCPADETMTSFEHGGKCWIYALKPAGMPTSGELGRPNGIAGE